MTCKIRAKLGIKWSNKGDFMSLFGGPTLDNFRRNRGHIVPAIS